MYKSLFMALAVFLLSAGIGLAEEMTDGEIVDEVVTVEFTGVAVELYEPAEGLMGAPTVWTVDVSADEENDFCSDMINVTVAQATPGPWGTYDESIVAGDMVEVWGACVMDETGCIAAVTLQGSEDYYLELAEEDEDGEVVEEDVVVEETEDETE